MESSKNECERDWRADQGGLTIYGNKFSRSLASLEAGDCGLWVSQVSQSISIHNAPKEEGRKKLSTAAG